MWVLWVPVAIHSPSCTDRMPEHTAPLIHITDFKLTVLGRWDGWEVRSVEFMLWHPGLGLRNATEERKRRNWEPDAKLATSKWYTPGLTMADNTYSNKITWTASRSNPCCALCMQNPSNRSSCSNLKWKGSCLFHLSKVLCSHCGHSSCKVFVETHR